MPFEECLRFDNHQRKPPIEESGQRNIAKRIAGVVLRRFALRSWNCASFSEKEILGDEGRARGQEQAGLREQLQILQPLQAPRGRPVGTDPISCGLQALLDRIGNLRENAMR
jgi:hypothetical protein